MELHENSHILVILVATDTECHHGNIIQYDIALKNVMDSRSVALS